MESDMNVEQRIMNSSFDFLSHKDEVDKCLYKLPVVEVKNVYRGDNRTSDVILKEGFQPFHTLKRDLLLNFIADFVLNKDFRSSVWNWWKYPGQRSIAQNNYPFVSTGIDECEYGNHEYKIQLDNFRMFKFPEKVFGMGLGFNKRTIEESDIIGIQIFKDEIVFATPIPANCITFIK